MSTSELSLAGAPALGGVPAQPELAAAPLAGAEAGIGPLLERLANEYFAGVPGPALELGLQKAPGLPLAVSGAPAPGPVSPPSGVFPSAASLGALGISPGAGWVPPAPGFLQSPPIASGPLPKEADLRTVPAMLSEGLGVSSPVGLARGLDANPEAAPYFLDLAGLPKTSGAPLSAAGASAAPPASAAGVGAPASPPTPGLGFAAPAIPGGVALPERVPAVTSVPLLSPPLPASAAAPSPVGAASAPLGLTGGLDAIPQGAPYFLELAGLPKAYGGSGIPAASPPSPAGASPAAGAAAAPGGAALPEQVPAGTSVPLVPASSVARAAAVSPADAASAPSLDAPTGGLGYDAHQLSLTPQGVDAPSVAGIEALRLDRGGRRQFDAASVRRDFPILKERVHGRE
ncbi:MAG TPA: hypothetical protein VNN80_21720, partial [Polyangiaceae bacterium]|nr:hypothetical protein [Polyangiaceae bacterium]